MHRKLACLSEGLCASFVWAFEWLLSGVNVSVFFQVLGKSKLLVTNHAYKLLSSLMSGNMSSQREPCGELLVTVWVFAFVGSFHFRFVLSLLKKVSSCVQVINFIIQTNFK